MMMLDTIYDIITPQELGLRIKMLREAKKWSQQQLSEMAGLSVTYISEIETGKRPKVALDSYNSISNALGVPVCLLLDEVTSKEWDLLQMARKADPATLDEAIRFLVYLLRERADDNNISGGDDEADGLSQGGSHKAPRNNN